MATSDRSAQVFDRLFDAAVPDLLAGTHQQGQPPVDGGRWPVSIACIPDGAVRDVLQRWMWEAVAYAGPGHFHTGGSTTSHFTVRALEPYREAARPEEGLARGGGGGPRVGGATGRAGTTSAGPECVFATGSRSSHGDGDVAHRVPRRAARPPG